MKTSPAVKEIVRLSRLWLGTRYGPREEAVRSLCEEAGYPRTMAEEILDLNFKKITPKNLATAHRAARRLRLFRPADRRIGLVLPSNVPDPAVVQIFLNALFGCGSCVKLSRGLKGFGRIFVDSLKKESGVFRESVAVTDSKEEFFGLVRGCQAVRAFGDDATLVAIKSELPGGVRFNGYGPMLSAGIVFESAVRNASLRRRTLRGLARDVWLYDQRGCLSPQIFFVEGDARVIAKRLFSEIETIVKRRGLPKRPSETAVKRRIFIDRLCARALDGGIELENSWLATGPVVYSVNRGPFASGPGALVTGIKPFSDLNEVRRDLGSLWSRLRGIVTAGNPAEQRRVRSVFRTSSARWFAVPGNLQNPPIEALLM